MKIKRKVLILLMLITGGYFYMNSSITAASSLENLKIYGEDEYVMYNGTNNIVQMPTDYTASVNDFRGVWVSAYAGDISTYVSETSYKDQLLTVLDNMEENGLNALVFHIRTHNDAFYETSLAPTSQYVANANFKSWDYLEWLIDECHSRGIEFHAWMNPYRISSTATTLSTILNKYKDYPDNPASKAENILLGSGGAILNPGEPVVRKYLLDVCMEVIRNYDVDAIHFDDYFYISGINDSETFTKYKESYSNNIEDFRRLQIDEFIYDLSEAMYDYNQRTNRCVQLGISPSGVYRNIGSTGSFQYDSEGTLTYPLGTYTRGFSHYDGYLYSDTKKWIDNEWIDYIIPQVYFSFEKDEAPYADLVDWWNAVVKNKKVNLYIGIGIYRKNADANDVRWQKNPYELCDEIRYNTKLDYVKGSCLYSYKTLMQFQTTVDVKKVKAEYWVNDANLPLIERYTISDLPTISEAGVVRGNNNYTLFFEKNTLARRYLIYRFEGEANYSDPSKVIAIVGNNSSEISTYVDFVDTNANYTYAIVPVAKNNQTADPYIVSTTTASTTVNYPICQFGDISYQGTIIKGGRITIILDKAKVFFGDDVEYKFYYSYDQEQWSELNTGNLTVNPNTVSYRFPFNDQNRRTYIKIEAINEFGKVTSEIITLSVGKLQAPTFMDEILIEFKKEIDELVGY